MLFKCDETKFEIKSKADEKNMIATYIRYLIDCCKTIIIATAEKWDVNPDPRNPFEDKPNVGLTMS